MGVGNLWGRAPTTAGEDPAATRSVSGVGGPGSGAPARVHRPMRHGAVDTATAFLKAALEKGPVPAGELVSRARQQDVSLASLRRAKQRLGIFSQKHLGDALWHWSLKTGLKVSKFQGFKVSKGKVSGRLRHLVIGNSCLEYLENVNKARFRR